MSIDTSVEPLIEFRKSLKEFPGRTVCFQTGYRWAGKGILLADGTRAVLETVVIGGLRYTSKEAIARFIEVQNTGRAVPAKAPQTKRARKSAAARRELAGAFGI